jgi:hypothetical protein
MVPVFRIHTYVVGHPDPLIRGTDPRIRIRTKISRIPNTKFCNKLVIEDVTALA